MKIRNLFFVALAVVFTGCVTEGESGDVFMNAADARKFQDKVPTDQLK